MTGLQIAQGLAAAAALVLMLYLLARKPRDARLRAVTALVTSWAIAYPFGIMATRGADFLGPVPMVSRLVQHVLLLVGAYSLICFFLFSAFDAQSARTRAWWHALTPVSPVAPGATWSVCGECTAATTGESSSAVTV
ncbi:MAG: hypothetical protein ACRDQZ_00690 [Mycobacteriales bacterium]